MAINHPLGEMKITVSDLEYHRNGVSGEGFAVARFTFKGKGRARINAIATVFNAHDDEKFTGYCAVVSLDKNGRPDIHACWRGDHFETELRHFIESDEGHQMMFPNLRKSEAA